MLRSLSLLPALAAVVLGQGVAQTTTPDAPAVTGCSGCYIVADVAQVIFADYTTTQTASAIVSDGQGRNGTVVRTTVFQPLPAFTVLPGGAVSGSPVAGAYVPLTGTVITVGGAALTSPTAYNLFTQFTQYTVSQNGDQCSTGVVTISNLPSAFTVDIKADGPATAIFDAEREFIAKALPQLTCQAGGVVVSTTVPVPVETTTVTSSTSGPFRPSPIAQTTTGAASTTSSSGITLSTSINSASSTQVVVTLLPTTSIATGAAATVFHQPGAISTALLAAFFLLPGLGAILL